MFDSLSGKLQNAFRNLRGLGKVSEANVADTLREVRMALLEADVNFKVARDFIERVKTKAIGAEVVQSVQPGQQIIKIIHDELVDLLGSTNAGLNLSGNPSCILMIGLHGSGKTTSSGKLARLLQKQGRQPLLVAADVNRPAAMDQLETLGKMKVPSASSYFGITVSDLRVQDLLRDVERMVQQHKLSPRRLLHGEVLVHPHRVVRADIADQRVVALGELQGEGLRLAAAVFHKRILE